jgi:hypothetical protein
MTKVYPKDGSGMLPPRIAKVAVHHADGGVSIPNESVSEICARFGFTTVAPEAAATVAAKAEAPVAQAAVAVEAEAGFEPAGEEPEIEAPRFTRGRGRTR